MRQPLTELPVGQEGGGIRVAGVPDWGGQAAKYLEFPAGTDFGPMLEGLPDDMCPARHWGYVIEGVIEVRYTERCSSVVDRSRSPAKEPARGSSSTVTTTS